MKKLLLCAVLALVSTGAFAEDYLYINGLSRHVGAVNKHNEQNYGLGYAWDSNWKWFGDVEPQFGFYKNSEWRWTGYVSFTKYYWSTNDKLFRLGTMQGLAVGYSQTPVLPVIALAGLINTKPVAISILLTAFRDGGRTDNTTTCNTVSETTTCNTVSTETKNSSYRPLIGIQAVIPF